MNTKNIKLFYTFLKEYAEADATVITLGKNTKIRKATVKERRQVEEDNIKRDEQIKLF